MAVGAITSAGSLVNVSYIASVFQQVYKVNLESYLDSFLESENWITIDAYLKRTKNFQNERYNSKDNSYRSERFAYNGRIIFDPMGNETKRYPFVNCFALARYNVKTKYGLSPH